MTARAFDRNRNGEPQNLEAFVGEDHIKEKRISIAHLCNSPQQNVSPWIGRGTTGILYTRETNTHGMIDQIRKVDGKSEGVGTFPDQIQPSSLRRIFIDCQTRDLVIPNE